MADHPQPAVDRMVEPVGHAIVAGVAPGQDELVPLTAVAWARAVRAPMVHFAYADVSRYAVEEHPDGTVTHAPIDPDTADVDWQQTAAGLRSHLERVLAGADVPWRFVYLAGRPDRALTHLARAVDAAAIVVGTRAPGGAGRLREAIEGSVAVHLAQHQHRPVLTVPLSVVDWKETRAPWQ
ncbi:universal stress protein [Xylanimonas ulmi]|uniref:Nucleotide-binding universal stress UspA family protein n=1 Tax=Xylanimonas ulmi TaxID=228973 RepID=A0A4Q7M074_9MICO|nr:universal stress protein [Xylanibacterium ulmi]RZS60117.1 nucleotide-binding universal stress UspA family protein [Xylanibacterium ulmi]